MKSLVDTGDICVVATVNGKAAGFAFATVVDDAARFHTLTVAPDMRGKGLAKELMRARLHFAKSLGVRSIILEIADWNLPSLSVSTSFGFRNIGNMYVETTRIRRMKKNIVRRW
jgi:L-amino acid N-acyltransferase YncA